MVAADQRVSYDGTKKNVSRCRLSYGLSGLRSICPTPPPCASADAATAPRGPAATPARRPSVVVVTGALALEWPALGVDLGAMGSAVRPRRFNP